MFVPPGTKRFYAKFQTYLSPTEAKASVRFGEVPVANADDVNQNTGFTESDQTLNRLIEGDELLFYSSGQSGVLNISQPNSTDDAKAIKGGYIYLNLLSIPAGIIFSAQTRMVVDEACYRRWYATAKWDSQNNPDENANHTCDGSIESGGEAPNFDKIATLSSSTIKNSAQGISTLTLKLKHPKQATGGTIDYFVAAHIPQFAYPFEQANDEWAFLALPETGTDAANWKVLFLATSLDNLAFKKGVAIPTGNQVTLPINLQLPIDALKSYDAKLYLGYRQGANGSFKALANPIWQANTP